MNKESILIEKALKGDENSFAEIIDLYKNYVFAIILNFIKDYNEVENVAQEVFLQIYLSLPNYESNNFKGWISRIASNKSIDFIRKKKAKFKEEIMEDEDELMDTPRFSHNHTPEEILIEKERKQEVSNLCRSVPAIYTDVIEKFYLEGKSYEEIAEEEGVTVKTIASRLYRGRNMLKEKWRKDYETL
ncbi:sigma-70 family RNA polymerase sigma factor [Tissierella pigra]|uniref:Sigma-70 family RNA polymerase sigma factor n=1 Tax=Tissierella pigra TaxID=2607614 RepID=A0A6N7XZX7_9FIRM|nr:sigma-70 family RNA polymerase sigma factor [Tissierella pigra]MBU5427707.1 sigma-70 family RNA polymerase sigma factor [Tissierella pigra]MSU03043.1 sigma-70 family RNA polymerase sigma factor [Tissierella pigra]